MQTSLMVINSVHVLAGAFWAGSTFTLARAGAAGDLGVRLFRPQMGAAALAMLSGGYLWRMFHEGPMSGVERLLGLGVACALLAVLLQAGLVGMAVRRLRKREVDESDAGARIRIAHRIAAALLALTIIAMAGARFAN
jgi:hypothetical protein